MKFKLSFFGPGRGVQHAYPKTFDAAVHLAEVGYAEDQATEDSRPKINLVRLYLKDESTDHAVLTTFWGETFQLISEYKDGKWEPKTWDQALDRLRKEAQARTDFINTILSMQSSLIARSCSSE